MATLTLATTVEQIAKNYKVDCLYLQTGNFHLRYPLPLIGCRLLVAKAGCPPITMSHKTTKDIQETGDRITATRDIHPVHPIDRVRHGGYPELFLPGGHEEHHRLLPGYVCWQGPERVSGRPTFNPNDGVKSEIMMTECDVRRGRLLPRWSRRKCILYNGGVRLLRGSDEGEAIPLVNKRIDTYDSRRGKCLRIHDSVSTTLLLFDDSDLLHRWLYKCQQVGHSVLLVPMII